MFERRQSRWLTTGGGMGIFVPALVFTFIVLSLLSHPQFSWTNNALSDLGVVPGITSQLFNFGLYTGGLMSLWFAIGLFNFLNKNVIGKIGATVFGGACIALEGIGIMPENFHSSLNYPFHYIVSVAFFTLVPTALLVIGSYFLITHEYAMAKFTLLIAIAAVIPWAAYFAFHFVEGVAIPELLSALAASAWAITIGWRMYQEGMKIYKVASPPKNP